MTASSYASDAKITEALAVLGADLIGQTEQTLLQQLVVAAALGGGGGGGGGGGASAWGSITGTLSAQTDLQTALNAKLNLAGGTLTGQLIQSTNGAASTPPVLLSGTVFTGGSATTTKPSLLVEPAGTTSTGWNTSGTMLGLNAPSGFTGNYFDAQINGVSVLRLTRTSSNGVSNMATLEDSASSSPQILFNWAHSGIAMRRKDSGWIGMFYAPGLAIASDMKLGFVTNDSASALGSTHDAYFVRSTASVIGVLGASAGGGAMELSEMTAPSAPATNKARIYLEDNGSGKTRLMIQFATGAAQQIAIEP